MPWSALTERCLGVSVPVSSLVRTLSSRGIYLGQGVWLGFLECFAEIERGSDTPGPADTAGLGEVQAPNLGSDACSAWLWMLVPYVEWTTKCWDSVLGTLGAHPPSAEFPIFLVLIFFLNAKTSTGLISSKTSGCVNIGLSSGLH